MKQMKSKAKYIIEDFENLASVNYEGWRGWFTWSAMLWFNNDEAMYNRYHAMLNNAAGPEWFTAENAKSWVLANYPRINKDISNEAKEAGRKAAKAAGITTIRSMGGASELAAVMGREAMRQITEEGIDWQEIADHMKSDYLENLAYTGGSE